MMQADEVPAAGQTAAAPREGPSGELCGYRFVHPNPPWKKCGRPVHRDGVDDCRGGCRPDKLRRAKQRKLCFWHCACTHSDKAPGRVKQTKQDLAADLKADLGREDYLEGAWLEGANLKCADLKEAHLEGLYAEGAHLEGTGLGGAALPGAVLNGAHLEDASIGGANLAGARLRGAHLQGAWLGATDLRDADLTCARLEGAHLGPAHRHEECPKPVHAECHCVARLGGATLHGATLDRRSNCDRTDWGTPDEEGKGRWSEAAAVFREIGRHYAEKGYHEKAHEFYLREMRAQHREVVRDPEGPAEKDWWDLVGDRWARILKHPCIRRFTLGFHRYFWGYGVSPGLVFFWIAAVIAIWAIFNPAGLQTPLFQPVLGVLLAAFLVSLATKYVHRD